MRQHITHTIGRTKALRIMRDCIVFALNTGKPKEYSHLRATLRRHGFVPDYLFPVEGSYNGEIETSYVYPWTEESLRLISSLTRVYGQESVMLVDDEYRTYLKYLYAGTTELIGRLTLTTAGNAAQQAGYTRINYNYFTVIDI